MTTLPRRWPDGRRRTEAEDLVAEPHSGDPDADLVDHPPASEPVMAGKATGTMPSISPARSFQS